MKTKHKPGWELAIDHEAFLKARCELGIEADFEEVEQLANKIAAEMKAKRLAQASASFGMADFQGRKGL